MREWRSRCAAHRLEGLSDEPRPGAPRKITDEPVELVITKTLEERGPGQDTHWPARSMAAATGMSHSAVPRIWRAFGLQPHLVQTWKLSTDPQLICDNYATCKTEAVKKWLPCHSYCQPAAHRQNEQVPADGMEKLT